MDVGGVVVVGGGVFFYAASILPRILLILRHILVGLISSGYPRRRLRSDEQSRG